VGAITDKGDTRVLLSGDLVLLIATGAFAAGDHADRDWQREVLAIICAFPTRQAARELYRLAALVNHPGRLITGMKIRPVKTVALIDSVTFANRQAHIKNIQDPVGAALPKVFQSRRICLGTGRLKGRFYEQQSSQHEQKKTSEHGLNREIVPVKH